MKILLKALPIIALSLAAWSPTQAYTVTIESQAGITENYLSGDVDQLTDKRTLAIPADIAQGIETSKALYWPTIFQSTSSSLDQYISSSTKKPEPDDAHIRLADFVRTQIKPQLREIQPLNAVWEEKEGRVVNFNPGQSGLSYDLLDILASIEKNIAQRNQDILLSPYVINPETSLASLNNYGVETLIARGRSTFGGSSYNRTTNIRVGTSKYKGLIIAPDQVFSFNHYVGEINARNGWVPEIVIKGKDLVPEFGGGICQVSTTAFRAALNAGFPINERKNHALAVNHYAPQGTDATIYTGAIDLKFTNNSGSYIMIWPYMEGTRLTFDIYGKRDGRVVRVEQPVRYDVLSTGAFKTAVKRYITTPNGETKEDVFRSSYRPAAEFKRTTTATEPPKTPVTTTP